MHGGLPREDVLRAAAGSAAVAGLGFPAVLRAQQAPIRVGHLTPRTGFLAPLGEYGVMGARQAVDEINEKGGVLGRKVELITEDSQNPGVAKQKVIKLIEKDKVDVLIGEISSASGLAISEEAQRYKIVYVNTGFNTDEARGARCQRYMFHVEGANTMYTKTIGRWLIRERKISRWYFLTADYAFGHDLYRVSARFLKEHGGTNLGNEMIPTNTPDYSGYILKLKAIKPDIVYLNLAGVDQTTFLKQYRDAGSPFELAGGVMDTQPFWAAGIDALSGHWQSLWFHELKEKGSPEFTAAFRKRYGKPPENQAWGDYIGTRILLQAMQAAKSTKSADLVRYLEGGASFDILKGRPGTFRAWDHQLLQTMYVVKVKDKAKMKDQWDIFEIVEAVPKKDESLELIQPTKEENPCKMPAI
ncbi:MAG: ABC transporter substrate-binding protein [candidate division NC10 bacterium]|nr:ABC transporter substrate-binding protein [candidate division NC10 bacterium]